MPVYEYECNKCRFRFEVTRGVNESGGSACPRCGGEGRRVYLPTPLLFKGSGFYITDSRKKTEPAADKGGAEKPDSGKTAEKPGPSEPVAKSAPEKSTPKPDTGKK